MKRRDGSPTSDSDDYYDQPLLGRESKCTEPLKTELSPIRRGDLSPTEYNDPKYSLKRPASIHDETSKKPKYFHDESLYKNNIFMPPHLNKIDSLREDPLKMPSPMLPFGGMPGLGNPFLANMLKGSPLFPMPPFHHEDKDKKADLHINIPGTPTGRPLPPFPFIHPMMPMYPGMGSMFPIPGNLPGLNNFPLYPHHSSPFPHALNTPSGRMEPRLPVTPNHSKSDIPKLEKLSPPTESKPLNLTKCETPNSMQGLGDGVRGYRSLPFPLKKKDGKMHYECNICQKVFTSPG